MKLFTRIATLFCAVALIISAGTARAGDPIPGVDVHLLSSNGKSYHVKTDAEGHFTFQKIEMGTYKLYVSNKACRMAINTKGTGATTRQASPSTSATPTATKATMGFTVDTQPPTITVDLDNDGRPDVVSPRESSSGMATGRRSGSVIIVGDDCDDKDVECATLTFSSKKEFKGHVTLLK
jgi:hypothetical protein